MTTGNSSWTVEVYAARDEAEARRKQAEQAVAAASENLKQIEVESERAGRHIDEQRGERAEEDSRLEEVKAQIAETEKRLARPNSACRQIQISMI